ncbi:fimbrial biogenesis usher protein [Cronobacter turicensis]|uniref:fimbrial biogenesis usher protein n=1 Tax=Cronobacter turicensis TaxID=413502 RepID=UPI0011ACB2F2|nr:fimbrial biogenesis usher protein [Cronobacter turicensis]TWR36693.1 fimbria/pilus outer membrane usher protein [Cronobacter turicensis]
MYIRVKRVSALVSLCLAQATFFSSMALGQEAQFDTDILKNRGLDSTLGNYFADAPKFMPGRRPVSLTINGKEKGTVTARFGDKGQLCVDRPFLQSAGLQIPVALRDENADVSGCYDYQKDYPSVVITPLPGEENLSLVVPQEALSNEIVMPENMVHGGTAAMMNYSLISSQYHNEGGSSHYDQLSLENGINIHDWLLRSRQTFSRTDDKTQNDVLYTYVQHTFERSKKLMQAGQINISNTLFSGASIDGVQFIPENGLVSGAGSGISVTGMARSAQARVEVKQNGQVIYSTLVPAGPFTLEDVKVVSMTSALDVTVTETDGSKIHYTVAADALSGGTLSRPQGFSLAMGRTQDKGDNNRQPWLATVSDGWHLRPWLNMSVGAMSAQQYNALAAQLDARALSSLMVSTTARASQDNYGDNKGHSTTLNINYSASSHLGLSASATRYSKGYRELTDTLDDDFSQYSGQYNFNTSWSHPWLGSFSLGYSLNKGADGDRDSRYLNASWGKTFRWATVSVNWQNLLNPAHDESHRDNQNYGDMLYVNVAIPLGTQRISAYTHQRDNETRNGMSLSGDLSRNTYYSVSVERDKEESQNSFNGSVNSNLHYTQLGLSAGKDGTDSSNTSVTLNGGIVAHSNGVTFSPYTIQDTFGIASVNEHVSGVEIGTPDGPVWTDHWGQAVVSSLPEYQPARVEMNTETLPKNIDVNNGISMAASGHGAVSNINFSILNVRRAMLNVTMRNGHPLPKNATLVDGEGNYVTTVVDDGLVFLNDVDGIKSLILISEEGQRQCTVHYQLPKEAHHDELYEQVKGVCQ